METKPDPKAKEDEEPRNVPVTKNAQQFVDYIPLLAYSGAREQEALALRWQDVDIERGQLTVGATGDTKNSTGRVVDFNPKPKAHLEEMATLLAPDCKWLFPSPQRGEKDIHCKTFLESLKLVRTHAASKEREASEKQQPDCGLIVARPDSEVLIIRVLNSPGQSRIE
jgi:integrase